MKNTMKVIVLGASLVLPLASFAEDTTMQAQQPAPAVSQPAPATSAAKPVAAKAAPTQIMLNGVKSDNTSKIIALAKKNGASKASVNSKTGVLTVSGSKFNKDKFTSSIGSVSGVSLKN